MKINWNDLLVLGLICAIILFVLNPIFFIIGWYSSNMADYMNYLIIFIMLNVYFYRNENSIKTATVISFIFGFALSFMAGMGTLAILASDYLTKYALSTIIQMITHALPGAIISIFSGTIAWFLTKKFVHEKMDVKKQKKKVIKKPLSLAIVILAHLVLGAGIVIFGRHIKNKWESWGGVVFVLFYLGLRIIRLDICAGSLVL